jgi:Holliday junction resolvasome RuvABC ATP-dependent DNA helicase subunit
MFGFLKKCIQIEEPKSARERAIRTFSRIEGLDDVKEMLLRALKSQERAHTLLIGPPACAESLFVLEIEKLMRSKVYFTKGSSTTKARLQKFIAENQHKEIIIIDEIDKMSN